MKKYLIYLFTLTTLIVGCDSFKDLSDATEVEAIDVNVDLDIAVENVAVLKDLKIKFDNYDEDLHYVEEVTTNSVKVNGIIPGIYSVTVSGTAIDIENSEYTINGNSINEALFRNESTLNIKVQGLKRSPLIFKEIYYCGSRPKAGGVYFRDQFYEIYNNSAETQYLDGIYFANLTPGKSTTKLPVWPAEDGDNYAYAERVWKFPGNGTEYPLKPGESCVISQFAANHQLDIYNPLSPIDGSSSEFEFNMNNKNFPDQPAYDMLHVFYNGKAEMGTVPQYLTSVFGGAYVIFSVPEGETWDPVNDANMKATDQSKPNSTTYYAKIPIKYVLDAVEAIDNESMMNAKRVPAVLDAGITWVGATYCGLGVARKLATDDDGNPVIREETGTYFYQDTNNSTDDFERGVVPMLRRNGAKMPSWNHTLQ